jgi:hypothetical protein
MVNKRAFFERSGKKRPPIHFGGLSVTNVCVDLLAEARQICC